MLAALVLAVALFTPPAPKCVLNNLFPLYERAAISLLSKNDCTEFSFTYDKDGTVHPIESSHASHETSVTITKRVTAGIVHTHPLDGDPKPSQHDVEIAKKTGLPDYVLSSRQLWVALPSGKIKLIAFVEAKKHELVFFPPR
jgi:proteasome lid subunit RPN8/RPN11